MNYIKKSLLFISVVLLLQFPLIETQAAETTSIPISLTGDNFEITPYVNTIEWRYKIINGRLYKRQYNYVKNRWIGNWILIK